ncbi:MAG TPA: ABC transporter ATP-binding protein [Pseudonocardiaceae bacterium]|nr:ABC transporter ATP-binding protein [Pseudonocardiaceae bacterium]
MLTVTGLIKRYGARAALDGFDLTARPGEIVGLVGRNGAGKTTFVDVVTGLVRPDAGQVTVAGVDALRDRRAVRRLVGVAPQDQALYLPATVREHLRLFGSLAGLRAGALRAAIEATAEELLLTDVLDQQVGRLSGGQRRRTQAACALLPAPAVLLLDEPTVGADPTTRRALLAAVLARAAAGASVVYTTHYLPELADLAATLAVADAGRVIARGSQAELLAGLPAEVSVGFGDGVPPVRVNTFDPAATLAAVLSDGRQPESVDIHRPGLDDLYRSLEGLTSHAA